jgi:hypothetical protein
VGVEVIAVMTVYTVAEVAEILKVTEGEVWQLVQGGQLPAFPVIDDARVKEEALIDFMNRPYPGSLTARAPARSPGPSTRGEARRTRNPELEQAYRQQVIHRIRQVTGELRLVSGRANFTANGKEILVRIATTPGVIGRYWFGFSAQLVRNEQRTFLVLGLADREEDLVIPCDRFSHVINGLSADRSGHKKLNVEVRSGSYYLTGKGIEQPLPLDSYVNAFDLLR